MSDTVHVFVSTGRFRSAEDMDAFVDVTYTDDGDSVPSSFMEEVGLCDDYEPTCIEVIRSESGQPVPLSDLLEGASYYEQWLDKLDGTRQEDAAICVFAPNIAQKPEECSMEYLGAFPYNP